MEIAQAVEMLKSLAHNYGTEDHISAINKIENRIVALQQDLVSYGDNIHVCQVEIATLKDAIAELEAQVATLHDNLTQTEATLAGVVEDAKRYKAELAEWHNSCSTEIAAHLKTEDDLERYMLALDLAVENIDPYIVVCAAESGNDVVNAYLNKADAILKEQKDANVRTV